MVSVHTMRSLTSKRFPNVTTYSSTIRLTNSVRSQRDGFESAWRAIIEVAALTPAIRYGGCGEAIVDGAGGMQKVDWVPSQLPWKDVRAKRRKNEKGRSSRPPGPSVLGGARHDAPSVRHRGTRSPRR